jgi:hypothetical protein
LNTITAPSAMSLEAVRTELLSITGQPLRDDAGRLRRQMLRKRLDQLLAART